MLESHPDATFISPEQAQEAYGIDTGGALRNLAGAVIVHEASAVPRILEIANRNRLKLWPISGGRNFGYGTALPAGEGNLIVDLGRLKRIEYFADSQTFTIEPGVTQQDLADYLDAQGLNYLVPTTGVGPNGNLLGNALDGGYGLTPVADHFEALTAIDGFWGNGEPFGHSYEALGCHDMARRWSAGLGPSVQSLLRQGNFAIVTRATVRLARAPESCRVLIFEWPSDDAFFTGQDALSRLVEELPMLGGIIAMNGPRILATQDDAPLTSPLKGAARQAHLDALCKERRIAAWTGVGTLYGPHATLSGVVKDLRRRLPGVRILSFTPSQIRRMHTLAAYLPRQMFPTVRRHLGSLVDTLGTVEGRPIVAFLRIAYALDASLPAMDATRHPAKDGQGILWYAPLVPFTEAGVRAYAQFTSEILMRHGFDPLLAVTTRSSRVHSGTIPLNFLKTSEAPTAAKACYQELVDAGIAAGMPPYRIGTDFMESVYAEAGSMQDLTWQRIGEVLDPNAVVSPGRYSRPR